MPGLDSTKRAQNSHVKRSTTAQRFAQKTQFTKSTRKRNLEDKPSDGQHSAIETEFASGTVIGGVFKIKSTIGLGGMGMVYIAEHTALGRHFALKVLRPELVNEKVWLRFQAEAKTLAALNHNTFVKVYDLGIHEKAFPYYSMDLVQGRNLEQIVAEDGAFKLNSALKIFITVLEGLAYAHRNGIIHRDIKPANIMFSESKGSNADEIKILDFGISKLIDSHERERQNLTRAGEVFGSPYYMSPEQCMGESVDARTDIYSIGCSLFEALTGFLPFDADNSVDIITMHQETKPPALSDVLPEADFPASIEFVIKKCLEKLPVNRYQTAKELEIDLTRVLEGKDPSQYYSTQTHARAAAASDDTASDPPLPTMAYAILAAVALTAIIATIYIFSNQSEADFKEFTGEKSTRPNYGLKLVVAGVDSDAPKIDENYKSIEEENTYNKNAPPSARDYTPFAKQETKSGGSRHLMFSFPTDIEIGQLQFSSKGQIMKRSAMGEFELSVGEKPIFIPAPGISDYPIYWRRFRPADLYGVTLIDKHISDDAFNLQLAAASKIGSIRALTLSNQILYPRSLISLNNFHDLKEFNGEYLQQNQSLLMKAKFWKTLSSFAWQANQSSNTTDFLRLLQNSAKLEALSTTNAILSHSDFELISSMSKLRFLYLTGTSISLADLEALSKLPEIETLYLPKGTITRNAIPILKKFKSLKQLSGAVVGTHEKLDALLKTELPKVNCNIYSSNQRAGAER
ncbi:hypothetical protein BH11CYA1_BH11CYA1_03560 [soil metagenome]